MQTLPFKVFTYNGTETPNTIYLLNKGLNSGKPSYKPFTNSFAVQCTTSTPKESIFAVLLLLYHSKLYEPYIHGTAIPFIKKHDLMKVLREYVLFFVNNDTVQAEIKKINALHQQIANLREMEKIVKQILVATCRKSLKLNT